MNHIMGLKKGDVYFSTSDIGWVVGHSFIIYGPLLMGAATVIYEGKPNTPDPGAWWKIIEKHKAVGLYTVKLINIIIDLKGSYSNPNPSEGRSLRIIYKKI